MSIVIVTIGNLIGSLIVAYLFAVKTGVIGSATPRPAARRADLRPADRRSPSDKALTETDLQIFLRAVAL